MTQFRETLSGMLTSAMAAQGPVEAIAVCSASAPALAMQAAQDGIVIVIGRATDRARNPANLAAGWQAEALGFFAQRTPATRSGARFERVLDDGSLALALPLEIKAPCLTCHGTALAPAVAAALTSRYPSDAATGYAEGDLRGVLWATVK